MTKLPPLPEPIVSASLLIERQTGIFGGLFTPSQMQAYGQACRDAALEEAAKVCVAIAVAPSNVVLGVAMTCADKIRSLK